MNNHVSPKTSGKRIAFLMGGLVLVAALFVVAIPMPAAQYFRYFSIIYPGANNTAALGINRAGVVVGAHADPNNGFVWQQGTFTTVLPPGASESSATGINTIGQIVGYYADSTGYHGFLYSAGNYSILDVPGALARCSLKRCSPEADRRMHRRKWRQASALS